MICACIFLSSKVEEVPVSNNHLINCVRIVCDLHYHHGVAVYELLKTLSNVPKDAGSENSSYLEALQPHVSKCSVMVSESYYAAKSDLGLAEQQLLRLLQFKLSTPQPYTHMFHICHLLSAPPAIVATSINLLNDIQSFSQMGLDVSPLHMAVAAVHLASIMAGMENQLPCRYITQDHANAQEPTKLHWCEAVGVSFADVERIGHQMMDVAVACEAVFSRRHD